MGEQRGWLRWGSVAAVAIGLGIGAGFALGPLARRPRRAFPRAPIEPFGQLELAQEELPTSGPVPIALALIEPSADARPLPASLFSMSDKRKTHTEARLDAARTIATIEIDPAWLLPGTYLVQLRTTERSVFPLRRYAIVVR